MAGGKMYYQDYLKAELASRCRHNPRYSVRAFARALKLSPGALSQILSGKRVPSPRTAERLLDRLGVNPEAKQKFLSSVAERNRIRGLKRLSPIWRSLPAKTDQRSLNAEAFQAIAEIFHYAILELTFVKGFRSDPRWIASVLGLSQAQAKIAIERLLKLGLLTEKDKALKKTDQFLTTKDKTVTSAAHRLHQKQVLSRAMDSLQEDPIDERCMMSMTMAIDPQLLPEARKMIQGFIRSLCEVLESGERKRVYQLGVALYPLQRKEESK